MAQNLLFVAEFIDKLCPPLAAATAAETAPAASAAARAARSEAASVATCVKNLSPSDINVLSNVSYIFIGYAGVPSTFSKENQFDDNTGEPAQPQAAARRRSSATPTRIR